MFATSLFIGVMHSKPVGIIVRVVDLKQRSEMSGLCDFRLGSISAALSVN